MNYLLTGAEFNNKGAEAMTLVALKNIYENDENASVFLLDSGFYPKFELKKSLTYISLPIWNLRKLCGIKPVRCYRARIKDFIKFFLPGKKSFFGTIGKTKKPLKTIDIVIDISGFAFSSKWGDEGTLDWLSQMDLMQKIGARIFLMPQSFGPFDFKSANVVAYGKTLLEKCERVFAREDSGYELLKGLGLTNVMRMTDSVLLEKNFNASPLIKDYEKYIETIEVPEKDNIAIIPNYRLIDVGGTDCEKMLSFYSDVINKYVDTYHFYLIAHAGEDLSVCKMIKDKFINNNRVTIINHVMYSFNYEEFIKKMNFIIASRYHAIIHAYKESVPAVVLGWADKYYGIVSDVKQKDYLIDLNQYEESLKTVDKMATNYRIESNNIKENVMFLQKQSCYDFLKSI